MQTELRFVKNLSLLFKDLEELSFEKIFLICDARVYDHYRKEIEGLEKSKFILWKTPENIQIKSWEVYHQLENYLLQKQILKSHLILTLGGGSLSDLGGFIAATLLRGISWINIPTTLLSQVDAGIGGKVGLDTSFGKNLVGAIYHPQIVYICSEFIDTLSETEVDSGKGEILKYALLDTDLEKLILEKGICDEMILSCAHFKQKIVMQDPQDKGPRRMLNLGHTFGHAFEMIYKLPHGTAVVEGIKAINLMFHENRYSLKIDQLINKLEIRYSYPAKASWEEIEGYLLKDKKRKSINNLMVVSLNSDQRFIEIALTEVKKRYESLYFT